MPKISIIVPVYKVEKYIHKCIDSILSQDFTDFEVILVDDGSPDNCGKICDEYASKDSRVKVIHKENGGLSSARNAGIDIATGDYIGFVDSDDYISADMYSKMYISAVENSADIVACNLVHEYERTEKKPNKLKVFSKEQNDLILDNYKGMECLLLRRYFDNAAWNKLYLRALFTGVRFPEGRLFEDIFTVYKLFSKASKVIYIHDPLYYYLQRYESIMGQKFSNKKLDRIHASFERYNFISLNYPSLSELAYARYIDETMAAINDCIRSKGDLTLVKDYVNELVKGYRKIVNNTYIDNKRKKMLMLLRLNFSIYRMVVNIL